MKCRHFIALVATALVVAGPTRAAAQQTPVAPAAAPVRPQDDAAIRASSAALAKAFESGDAVAVAALFTDEAEYVDDLGVTVHGRDALAKAYGDLFAAKQSLKAESKTDSIRFVGTDAALEEGTFTVTASGAPPNASRFSALHVRQGGKWLVAMLKEWGDAATSAPKLDDLAWLIGTWETMGADASAKTTYSWSANKKFIRVDFFITPKEGEPSHGSQVIGVDPAVGQIRGWLFGSDGGIGESTWSWNGDAWMIESIGTLADGTPTTALNFLAKTGSDAFTWRSVGRTTAGEPEPDIAPVTVRRVATTSAVPAPAPK